MVSRILFWDSSALLPICLSRHPQHFRCLALFRQQQKKLAWCLAPSLGELYATLTTTPERQPLAPRLAREIANSIAERVSIAEPNSGDYLAAINYCVAENIVGPRIRDVVVARVALRLRAQILTVEPDLYVGLNDSVCPDVVDLKQASATLAE
jgi:hypothetical protein